MRDLRYFLLCSLICFSFTRLGKAQSIAQEIKFKHLDANPKLSHLDISSIFQASNGFLWIGTGNGLNRFDGYDFKIYKAVENDSTTLLKNTIQTVFEDSRQTLWVSTLNSGLHYYDQSTDTFHSIKAYSHKDCQVLRIIEDADHHVWISGVLNNQAFVAMLDHVTGLWQQYLLFSASEGIHRMVQHSENEFWLSSRVDGLFKWNKSTNKLEQFPNNPNEPNNLAENHIEAISKDYKGNLWIGTHDHGLYKLDSMTNQLTNFNFNPFRSKNSLACNTILDICVDDRILWIGTENGGLSKMNLSDETITNYFYEKGNPNALINNSIWALHKDHQGRIWIGTYAKGLCVIDKMEEKFQTLVPSMENDLINVLFEDSKGRLWIGTEDGISLKDGNMTNYFKHDFNNPKSISSNAILCIYEDKAHQIWIGTWNGGLNRFDEQTGHFIHYNQVDGQSNSLSNPNVFAIGSSPVTGELLVGTFGGLNVLKDPIKGIFEMPFSHSVREDGMIYTILTDRNDKIWVGARSGLFQYTLENNKYKRYIFSQNPNNQEDIVNCLFEDSQGTMWIGSNEGLHKRVDENQFITYTIEQGLPINIVQGILEDKNGNLWLGTTKGLSCFNIANQTFKNYDQSDGLLTLVFRQKAFFKLKNGQMSVGGSGINTFYPDSIKSNLNKPKVYITDLKIFNQSILHHTHEDILTTDVMVAKEIYLNHTHQFFSLHYVGINFTASYKNQYAYQLEGFDEDWVEVGTQRFATYTNLDPGKYTFRVKASNNDGLWNEEGATLTIHVLPPWWQTWWAYVVFVGSLLTIVYFIVRLRTYYLNAQRNLLKSLVLEGTAELKTKNERIAMQAEELQTFNESLNALNENLEKTVIERTSELTLKNEKLADYAFINAHNLRVPVANIKGILQLFENKKSIEEVLELIEMLKGQSENLDKVLIDIQRMLEKDNLIKQQEHNDRL